MAGAVGTSVSTTMWGNSSHVFLLGAVIFVFAALLIWLSSRPRGPVDTGAAH
ncbi:hypothetical protein [Sphingomonas sp. DT-204]|uniref:hypothetical protein n=1 Tax=Sphingomonas sp. DT-204 TaxID=3396166 RepID=UPI003F1A3045